jgi:phage terminase large subunit-like protein
MRFGLRTGPNPHWVASTTPKPRPLIKRLNDGRVRGVALTRATYRDNPYIPEEIKELLEETYGGTQLGRQELMGELIEEDENALWTQATIDAARVAPDAVPDLGHISVGVDPSGGAGEQGIVVSGKSKLRLPPFAMPQQEGLVIPGTSKDNFQGFVLADRTCRKSPPGWGAQAVKAAVDFDADEIVVERNYGGSMAVEVLRSAAEAMGVPIPINVVWASRGKAIRADPVAAITSQGRWHHAGQFPELEMQMTTWYQELDWSPDRLDGSVWTAHNHKLVHLGSAGIGKVGSQASRQVIG